MRSVQLFCVHLALRSVQRGRRRAAWMRVPTPTLIDARPYSSSKNGSRANNFRRQSRRTHVAVIEPSDEAPIVRVDSVKREEGIGEWFRGKALPRSILQVIVVVEPPLIARR
jgi:hypothetical protein